MQIAYIPHARVSKFLDGEWKYVHIPIEWNKSKNLVPQKNSKS